MLSPHTGRAHCPCNSQANSNLRRCIAAGWVIADAYFTRHEQTRTAARAASKPAEQVTGVLYGTVAWTAP
jgi:hypothetical protein